MLDIIDPTKKLVKSKGPTPKPAGTPDWPWEKHEYARYLREMRGRTWNSISEELGVPVRTLQSWGEKEVWKERGATAPEMEQFTRARFMELAAANGMPKTKAVQLLVEGMTKPIVETTQDKVTEEGEIISEAKTLPDYATRHKFQKDYWVLAGLYSTNKQMEINNNGEGTVNVQVIIPEKAQG